jgi:hypothetical protein
MLEEATNPDSVGGLKCCSPQKTACSVCCQVRPAGCPAWQESLMQLVHGTHHDGACYAPKRHAPAARATCHTGSCAHRAKDKQVRQFVPGRRKQPNGNGLGTKNVKRCAISTMVIPARMRRLRWRLPEVAVFNILTILSCRGLGGLGHVEFFLRQPR